MSRVSGFWRRFVFAVKVMAIAVVATVFAMVVGATGSWLLTSYSNRVTVSTVASGGYRVYALFIRPVFPLWEVTFFSSNYGGDTLRFYRIFSDEVLLEDGDGDGVVDVLTVGDVSWRRGRSEVVDAFLKADRRLAAWKSKMRVSERIAEALAEAKVRPPAF